MNDEDPVCRAVYEVLAADGVVLLPTDVGYGLVACGDAGISRIYELKGRPLAKACITVATMDILDDVAELPDRTTRAWVEAQQRSVPIAVVAKVRAQSELVAAMTPMTREQATTKGTIACFLNAGPLVIALAKRARRDGRVVVGSSANLAFTGNNYSLGAVPPSIRDRVDLVVPGPAARYSNDERLATTILDLGSGEFIRKGIAYAEIADAWAELGREAQRTVTAS